MNNVRFYGSQGHTMIINRQWLADDFYLISSTRVCNVNPDRSEAEQPVPALE
jgi:hypothetical protein